MIPFILQDQATGEQNGKDIDNFNSLPLQNSNGMLKLCTFFIYNITFLFRELLAKIILNANNTGKMKTPHLSSIVFQQISHFT